MNKIIKIEKIGLLLQDDKYCNCCNFKKYLNRDLKHVCILFKDKLVRDGDNFLRLDTCKSREVEE